jgi:hypothetical protein
MIKSDGFDCSSSLIITINKKLCQILKISSAITALLKLLYYPLVFLDFEREGLDLPSLLLIALFSLIKVEPALLMI